MHYIDSSGQFLLDPSALGERSPHVHARFTWKPIYRVRRPKFPLARRKILHALVPTIPASGFVSNELQFGSLFAPVGMELSKALKVET